MIDIVSELDGIECFKHASVNENCGNDKIDDAPDEIAPARHACAGSEGNYRGGNQDRRQDWPKDLPACHQPTKRPTSTAQRPPPNFSHVLNWAFGVER